MHSARKIVILSILCMFNPGREGRGEAIHDLELWALLGEVRENPKTSKKTLTTLSRTFCLPMKDTATASESSPVRRFMARGLSGTHRHINMKGLQDPRTSNLRICSKQIPQGPGRTYKLHVHGATPTQGLVHSVFLSAQGSGSLTNPLQTNKLSTGAILKPCELQPQERKAVTSTVGAASARFSSRPSFLACLIHFFFVFVHLVCLR